MERKTISVVLTLTAAVLTACAVVVAAATQSKYTVDEPICWVLENPCLDSGGAYVVVTGTERARFHVVVDGNGGWHVAAQFRLLDDTIGEVCDLDPVTGDLVPTGQLYRVARNSVGVEHAAGDGLPYTWTNVTTTRFISAGSADNFITHRVHRVTINSNGEITVDFDRATAECRG
jgi:hypothetical protein